MKLFLVAGARPNFMKIAPLAHALRDKGAEARIVHTGQHYDEKMSQTFFDELAIPRPDINLEVGSGSHVFQIAEVMKRLEPELIDQRPDVLLVVGDVNSTVSSTIAAVKLGIPVAHVEAGLRSFDRTMPEEINRILTDSISRWLFTSEPSANVNLQREGVDAGRIHFVGNVMIDTLLRHREQARKGEHHARLGLQPKQYAVLTLHRPSNVDDPKQLRAILEVIAEIHRRLPVVFVVHPRTRQRLEQYGFDRDGGLCPFIGIEPLGYLPMLGLMENARLVLTDSGGIQEETTVLGVPCLTLRENTERPVTVAEGTNRLVGCQPEAIRSAAWSVLDSPPAPGRIPDKWDGMAAQRIADILLREHQGASV